MNLQTRATLAASFLLLFVLAPAFAKDQPKKPKRYWNELRISFIEVTKIDPAKNELIGHFITPPIPGLVAVRDEYGFPEDLRGPDLHLRMLGAEEAVPTKLAVVNDDRAEELVNLEAMKKLWEKDRHAGWEVTYYAADYGLYSAVLNKQMIFPPEFATGEYWHNMRIEQVRILQINQMGLVINNGSDEHPEPRSLSFNSSMGVRDYRHSKMVTADWTLVGKNCICTDWLLILDPRGHVLSIKKLRVNQHQKTCRLIGEKPVSTARN